MIPRTRYARGFTLVELLVAVTLLSVLALLAFRGLSQSIDLRARNSSDMEDTGDLMRALTQLDRDMEWRLPDGVIPPTGAAPALPAAVRVATDGGAGVSLSVLRTALSADGQMRVQLIRYAAENGALVRYATTPSLNWSGTESAQAVSLRVCAQRLTVRMHTQGVWVDLPADTSTAFPPASGIEVVLHCDGARRYSRVYAL